MRIVIINPPHPSIGSRIPREQLPPLGLLCIGGPLIDDGHEVKLIDAEFGPMPFADIVREAVAYAPEAVLLGHSGSTSGHPIVAELTRELRRRAAGRLDHLRRRVSDLSLARGAAAGAADRRDRARRRRGNRIAADLGAGNRPAAACSSAASRFATTTASSSARRPRR